MKFKFLSRIILFLSIIGVCSCQDDELFPKSDNYSFNTFTRGNENITTGLVQLEDGNWKATQRVPLVGVGRIVDNISGALIAVGPTGNDIPNIVDTDLTNSFAVKNVIGANVATNQIVSIRDLNYVYAGGQKAGFVCKNTTTGLLDVNVLKSFWIDTYLKGKKQEGHVFSNASSILDLGLGNISGGGEGSTFLVEAEFSKPFDEVRIGINGINAEIANKLSIYYAYVGENPMIPAVNNGNPYFNNKVTSPYEGSYLESSRNKLIDADLGNGIEIGLVSALFQPHMSVNFGRDIPVGSEVGFYVTSGSLLELGAGQSISITTYDEKDQKQDAYSFTKIVKLGLLGGGKFIYSLTTTKPCRRVRIDFNGINVKLGASVVHYAFVREKTNIDSSSYFTIANATVYNPNYRFAKPERGSVKYELISGPNLHSASVKYDDKDGSGMIVGMNITGNYKIKATYTDEDGNTYEQMATITRLKKKYTACQTDIVNSEQHPNRYQAYLPDGFDGVIQIGGVTMEETLKNVVDSDTKNYITYKNDLNITLISNKALIGVKTIDGSTINSDKKKIRVGFVLNKSKDILGVDALQFLRIKLYNKEQEVTSSVGKENNGVSVSLIGVTNEQSRLSIDTEKEFDRIELFCTGLLTIKLGEALKVYHAFWETTDNCGDPGEECMQLITNANYGAVATTDTKGLADIGGTCYNLGNIVDGDIESHATIDVPVSAATGTTISVSFNTIKANQEIGFILTVVTGITNVNLINIMQIKAYLNDTEIKDNTTEGGLLGLKLAGSGQRRYISITPTADVNKLCLIIGNGVSALGNYLINGVYLRPDYDGDGIMDCIQDGLSTEITNLYVEPEDICKGSEPKFRVDGGEEGVTYTLVFEDMHLNTQKYEGNVTINSSGYLEFKDSKFFESIPVGEYYVTVNHDGKTILNKIASLTIHPLETTWNGKNGTNWHDWNNWDNGTPWECTNVILPSNVNHYPELKAVSKKPNCCHCIHFEPGAELVGQTYLKYSKAYIDKKIKSGSYQLLSAPLRSMVTGDMFVSSKSQEWNKTNYFTELTNDKYPENRIDPTIYQRFFSKTVVNIVMSRSANNDAAIQQTDWSRSFNAVSTPYDLGHGFAVKVEKDESEYTFHFPKSHNIYNYYDISGNKLSKNENIIRDYVGRLMIDNTMSLPYNLTLNRLEDGSEFLLGNPFMAHIHIQKLLEGNRGTISSLKIYRDGQYVTISCDGISSVQDAPTLINPMESVFVTVQNKSSEISIKISEEMIVQSNLSSNTSRSHSVSIPQLYINANINNCKSSCVILQSASANDGYRNGENDLLLIESEAKPEVAVFTAAEGKALSIQRVNDANIIPVGFYMKSAGKVELTFQNNSDIWNQWKFVDSMTGKRYSLTGNILLENVSTGSSRFYLEKD